MKYARWNGGDYDEAAADRLCAAGYPRLLSAVLDVYQPTVRLHTTLPQKIRHEIQIPSKEDLGKLLRPHSHAPGRAGDAV